MVTAQAWRMIFPIALAAAVACGTTTEAGSGSTEFLAADGAKLSAHMADSIHRFVASAAPRKLRIEAKRFDNRASSHIDTRLVLDTIRENLVKRAVVFVDPDPGKKPLPPARGLLYLSGTIRENRDVDGRTHVIRYTASMTLVDSLSAKVEWTESLVIEKRQNMRRSQARF